MLGNKNRITFVYFLTIVLLYLKCSFYLFIVPLLSFSKCLRSFEHLFLSVQSSQNFSHFLSDHGVGKYAFDFVILQYLKFPKYILQYKKKTEEWRCRRPSVSLSASKGAQLLNNLRLAKTPLKLPFTSIMHAQFRESQLMR